MRVLGIDPGTRQTGWGIIEKHQRGLKGIAAGIIKAESKLNLEKRLQIIFRGVGEVIETHKPDQIAIEDMFFSHRYVQGALKLGHARGVILLAAAEHNLEVSAYSPALVKRSIAGNGQAQKDQVARMVESILGLKKLPHPDATDALAIALTHLSKIQLSSRERKIVA
ncbi:MAG: crossover junction endodeoxyribonuclease RuvC [Myxococcales bacterium]|nr:MAG: crossover junction endodeoxyribonuclease RuvC [Myxococcales bacterium]